jgi:predicted SprT family Zn-dependent metalloprotease
MNLYHHTIDDVTTHNIIRKRGEVFGAVPYRKEILAKVHRLLEVSRDLYPSFDLHGRHVPVVFAHIGTTAGYARWLETEYGEVTFNIEINVQAITVDWNDTFHDTIPHEVAHIVTRYIYGDDVKSHGPEWKKIAIALGSTGKRTHSMPLKRVRKKRKPSRKFWYKAEDGTVLTLGLTQHKRLQAGVYSSNFGIMGGAKIRAEAYMFED